MTVPRSASSKAHTKATHDVARAERRRQALELRKAGYTFEAIAKAIGYKDHSGAYRSVQTALKQLVAQPAAEVRELELARLDQLLLGLWPRAIAGHEKAVASVLRIMERHADLLGLDAPKRQELTGKDGRPIQVESRPPLDYSLLSDEEVEHLSALGERLRVGAVEP
jgi:hypothetical protein